MEVSKNTLRKRIDRITVTLTLGTLREDGAYYATLNDDTTVYLLAQEKVASLLALL